MEAGAPTLLLSSVCFPHSHCPPARPLLRPRRSTAALPLLFSVRTSTSSSSPSQRGAYGGPRPRRDLVPNWLSNNDETVRILPILVGGASVVAVLLNRALSSIAPVADATSSQSRADILTLSLAVTNILAGLVWLSIKPNYISPEDPIGVPCRRVQSNLPDLAVHELLWVWNSLSDATCCRSLVILFRGTCLLQIGIAAESSKHDGAVSVDCLKLSQGSLYQNVLKSRKQSYLANLSLYPGRSELPFLPSNTQAVILQPVGDQGIAIIGGDTVRGFTSQDQAWMASIGDKLDATFSNL